MEPRKEPPFGIILMVAFVGMTVIFHSCSRVYMEEVRSNHELAMARAGMEQCYVPDLRHPIWVVATVEQRALRDTIHAMNKENDHEQRTK